jgi:hypothetical protein
MARDEARHAGFLNRVLLAEGVQLDLPSRHCLPSLSLGAMTKTVMGNLQSAGSRCATSWWPCIASCANSACRCGPAVNQELVAAAIFGSGLALLRPSWSRRPES